MKLVKSKHHVAKAVRFSPKAIKKAMSEVQGFNASVAVLITKGVGTMACAWTFCLIALASLPAILTQANVVPASTFPHVLISPSLILIVAWIAQTFIQLVLLSVIMVGQNVQSLASDARAEVTLKDTETVLDRLNAKTDGGIKELADRLTAIESKLSRT
jgi:hypothetical protein